MINKPTLLSQAMVDRALNDKAFYAKLPEFTQLKGAAPTTKVITGPGCSKCGRAKHKISAFKDFSTLSTALTPDGQRRLKEYFGVAGLMLNTMNPQSKQIAVKIL